MLLFSVRLGIIQNAKPQVLMLILKLNYYKYFFSVALRNIRLFYFFHSNKEAKFLSS